MGFSINNAHSNFNSSRDTLSQGSNFTNSFQVEKIEKTCQIFQELINLEKSQKQNPYQIKTEKEHFYTHCSDGRVIVTEETIKKITLDDTYEQKTNQIQKQLLELNGIQYDSSSDMTSLELIIKLFSSYQMQELLNTTSQDSKKKLETLIFDYSALIYANVKSPIEDMSDTSLLENLNNLMIKTDTVEERLNHQNISNINKLSTPFLPSSLEVLQKIVDFFPSGHSLKRTLQTSEDVNDLFKKIDLLALNLKPLPADFPFQGLISEFKKI